MTGLPVLGEAERPLNEGPEPADATDQMGGTKHDSLPKAVRLIRLHQGKMSLRMTPRPPSPFHHAQNYTGITA